MAKHPGWAPTHTDAAAYLLQVLRELAVAFQEEVPGPLGFHPAFVQAKKILALNGLTLPPRDVDGGQP